MKTLENNKLLAEFMGINLPLSTYNYSAMICANNGNYHKDWNWLMPLVDEIESLGADVIIRAEYTTLIYDEGEQISTLNFNSKIDSVYNACVEFVKWYNNNK